MREGSGLINCIAHLLVRGSKGEEKSVDGEAKLRVLVVLTSQRPRRELPDATYVNGDVDHQAWRLELPSYPTGWGHTLARGSACRQRACIFQAELVKCQKNEKK